MMQYATDANLAARQRLWRESRRDRPHDVHGWVIGLAGADDATKRVLEVGCGNGTYLERLPHAVGLDLSTGMLAAARGRTTAPLVCGDAQALPFPDRTFDVVLAPHMLYHVPDRQAAARELRRVLRVGGVCVASTNSQQNVPELVALVEGVVGDGWRWLRASFADFSMENGEEQLRVAFDRVDARFPEQSTYFVEDADVLADYIASLGDAQQPTVDRPWSDVVDECRRRVADVIAAEGSFRLTPRGGAFVCR